MNQASSATDAPRSEAGQQQPQATAAADFEQTLPAGQRWFNGFCENWIFAFIIAMALRQFFLEAYRIPTASMEPTLYGDMAMTQADHVVVDKMGFRFTGPNRWGVTVFQYPVPEVERPGGGEMKAITADGERLDSFFFRPLLQRNFVKRVIGMPGDVFYIAQGDVYMQQADGSFAVSPKPPAVQEVLWLPIYRYGDDPHYQPWMATAAGAAITDTEDGSAKVTLAADSELVFTQPLINLYVKPGPVNIRPAGGGAWQQHQVALTKPSFRYDGRQGSIYDLRNWQVNRLTTADLDSQHYGASLNERMDEAVRDVRVGFTPQQLSGTVSLVMSLGTTHRLKWELSEDGWQLQLDGAVVASGDQGLLGRRLELAWLDREARAWVDGEPLMDKAISAVNPATTAGRPHIAWQGDGSLQLAELAIDRDVHYTHDGVMQDRRGQWRRRVPVSASAQEVAYDRSQRAQIRETRGLFIPAVADPAVREELLASMAAERSSDMAWLQPLGVSPQTALRIPEGGYLMLGDNSPFSLDGRTWGWVPAANLRGRVIGVVFPRWKGVR